MARMARTQTNLQTLNDGMPRVSPKRFSHAVPNQVGELAGMSPFAGDLSSAFQNFFGQVNRSLSTLNDAEFEVRKQEAERYAQDQKAAAFAKANQFSQQNPSATGNDGVTQAMGTLSDEERGNTHFLTTFKKTVGGNIGDKIYGDFALYMADKNPANFESEAGAWWQKNFGQGTGDPLVDSHMQSAWMKNYESARVTAAAEAVKAQKERTLSEVTTDVFRRMKSSTFGWQDVSAITQNVTSIFPNDTKGTNTARALGIIKNAAVAQGQTSTQRFLAMLSQPQGTTPEGEPLPTLEEQFPAQVAKIRAETFDLLQRNATLGGMTALNDASTSFAAMVSQSNDEYELFGNVAKFAATVLPKLENMPGVPFAQLAEFRGQVSKKMNELGQYKLAMNQLHEGAMKGTFNPNVDAKYVEKYGADYLTRHANVLTGMTGQADEVVAANAGKFLKHVLSRFGQKGISDDTMSMIASSIKSADPGTAARGIMTLKMIDGTGNIGRMLLKDDAEALSKFDLVSGGGMPVPNGSLTQNLAAVTPQLSEAQTLIEKNGGIRKHLFSSEGSGQKIDKKFSDEFLGSKMAEAFEEAAGQDGLFTGWGSPEMAPEVINRIEANVANIVARRQSQGKSDWNDLSAIREQVAKQMLPSLVIENGVVTLNRGVQQADPDNPNSPIPYGTSVYNPAVGQFENTAETMRDDMAIIRSGLVGLNLDDGDIVLTKPEFLKPQNGQLLTVKETGLPLTIAVNQEYEAEQQFDNSGERISWWGRTFKSNQKIKFTGNLETDERLASMFLHQGIRLIPNRVGDKVIGYQLALVPRFTQQGQYTMQQLIEMGKTDQTGRVQRIIEQRMMLLEQMNIAP